MTEPVRHVDTNAMIDLLAGCLEESEKSAALAHFESCDTCERAFRVLAGDAERFRSRMRKKSPAALRRAGGVLVGAAVAVLAIMIWRRDPGPDMPRTEVPRLPEVTEFVQWRNGDARQQDEVALLEGLEAYSRGDMEHAIRVLSRPTPSARLETLRSIYLASAVATQGDWQRTLFHLQSVSEASIPEPWRSDVRWTRYVALSQVSAPAADSLLAEIERGDDDLARRARDLRASATNRGR